MGKDWNAELEKVNADMAKLTAELEAHGSAQTTSQTCKELSGYIEAKMADDLFVNPGPDNPYLKPPKGGGGCVVC